MKLTKVKIINWMYIDNTTIDVTNNAVLIGHNGMGKTSIIDAIQYALTGSKGDSKFNSAQGSSTRNLESYVRGAVGSVEKAYLRPDDTITYVLVQFEDEENTHVFGITLEYTNSLSEYRFYIKNQEIMDYWFIDNKENYKDFSSFKEQFETKEFEYLHTRKIYQNKIRDVMGLLPQSNYFKLLGKALQLKKLENINSFISEFLLEVDELDVSSLQDVISNIKRIRTLIDKNKEKVEILENINDLGEEVLTYSSKIIYNEDKKKISLKKYIENQLNLNENNLKKDRIKLDELQQTEKDLIEEDGLLNEKKELVTNKIRDLSPELFRIKDEIKRNNDNLEKNFAIIERLNDDFKDDMTLLNNYNLEFDEDKNNRKRIIELSKNKTNIKDISTKVDEIKNDIITRKAKVEAELKNINTKKMEQTKTLNYIKEELDKLESGKQTYPENVKSLIKKIEVDLYDYNNEKIEIKVLSQYLEIDNDVYRNAIEGYLDKNRLNIVVSPKHFKNALNTYHRYSNEIYGVNLIDTTKVGPSEIRKGSLSEFVRSDNIYALNYVRSLLNRVMYVDSINELNSHKSAITVDCMLYSSHIVRKINPNIYKKQYIGQEALRRNIENKKEEFNKISSDLEDTIKEFNIYSKIVSLYHNLKFFNNSSTSFNVFYESMVLKNSNIELSELLEKIESKPDLLILNEEQEKINEKLKENKAKKDYIYRQTVKAEESIKKLREDISLNSDQLEELSESIDLIPIIRQSQINDEILNINLTKTFIDNLDKDINKLKELRNKFNYSLVEEMKKYIYKYNVKYKAEITDLSKYKKDFKDIDHIQFNLRTELTPFEASLSKLITSDFVSKINLNINKINDTIKSINQKLKQSIFGEDNVYTIISKPSDKPKFKTLYEIALRNEIHSINMFNQEQNEKDHRAIEQILDEYNDLNSKLNINEILDVRKYFKFDVVVKSKDQTKHLSEVLQTQSGGEIQTPFYILITAAFEQTKDPRRGQNSFNIVLFDEAFSNMDPQRINEMLKFYDSFNIQTIISVPSKLESIASYVDTALGVHRKGERTYVIQLQKE